MSTDPEPRTAAPFLPYGRHTIEPDDVAAVVAALGSSHLTQGPRVEQFEQALAAATGARHAVVLANGTAALHAAAFAAGLGPGDEVVMPPISFVASANSVCYLGATPIFADVDPDQHNLEPEAARAALSPSTRAILAVDFGGHPADYPALRALCDQHRLLLIADACHSLGATLGGQPVGRHAHLTCLSFHPVKAVTTGEGGAVLTDDDRLAAACRRFRTHGIERAAERLEEHHGPWYYEMQDLGFNYRITDLQCALGHSQLGKLGRFLAERRRLAEAYGPLLAPLSDVRPPRERDGARSAWHLYPVEVPPGRRRATFERLRADGIGVQVHYLPIYRHPWYRRRFGLDPSRFTHAEAYYASAITLPLFPGLTDADQRRVVASLERALA